MLLFFLRLKFYQILKLRFRSSFGETDIIAKKKDVIIFVEVKYVVSDRYLYKALKTSNSSRLINNAKFFVSKKHLDNFRIRFDIIYVYDKMKIRHLKKCLFVDIMIEV